MSNPKPTTNNDPDLMGDGFAADAEVDEQPSKSSNIKGLWANPGSRKVIIMTTAVVVVALGFVILKVSSANRHQEAPQVSVAGQSTVSAPPADVREGTNPTMAGNAQYQQMVAAAVSERASEALASGDSSMPPTATFQVTSAASGAGAPNANGSAMPNMGTDANGAPSHAPAAGTAYATAGQQGQPGNQAQAAAQQPTAAEQAEMARLQAIQAETHAAANQAVTKLVEQRTNRIQTVYVSQARNQQQDAQAQQGQGAAQVQQVATTGANNSGVTLISAGEIEAARLDVAVNTDVSTEWVGTVLTGKYAGAKVIGTVERRGTLAHLAVNTLSFPAQRQSVPAAAVALDANTLEAGNATDVDRKLFVRYGVKPLAAGFAAVAQYLQSAGTTVVVNGATVSQTVPELTTKRAGQLVAGSAAQQIANDTTAMDTTPTVRVARGTVIGIFFLKPVVYTPATAGS
ncbi:MAG: DotG/IcmE/VirB10 family protein [Polaromonas sp.]|nr:DotG/IcmE/VirB10 family protein [Polaromonas sp.]